MLSLSDAECDARLPADLRALPPEARAPLRAVVRAGGSFEPPHAREERRRKIEQQEDRKRWHLQRARDREHEQQQRDRRAVDSDSLNAWLRSALAGERNTTDAAIDAAVERLHEIVLPTIVARLKEEWRDEFCGEINRAFFDLQASWRKELAQARKEVGALRDQVRDQVAGLKTLIAREIAEPAGRMKGEYTARCDFIATRLERMERAIGAASKAEDAQFARLAQDIHALQAMWCVEDRGQWRQRVEASFSQSHAPMVNLRTR